MEDQRSFRANFPVSGATLRVDYEFITFRLNTHCNHCGNACEMVPMRFVNENMFFDTNSEMQGDIALKVLPIDFSQDFGHCTFFYSIMPKNARNFSARSGSQFARTKIARVFRHHRIKKCKISKILREIDWKNF